MEDELQKIRERVAAEKERLNSLEIPDEGEEYHYTPLDDVDLGSIGDALSGIEIPILPTLKLDAVVGESVRSGMRAAAVALGSLPSLSFDLESVMEGLGESLEEMGAELERVGERIEASFDLDCLEERDSVHFRIDDHFGETLESIGERIEAALEGVAERVNDIGETVEEVFEDIEIGDDTEAFEPDLDS